MHRAVTAASYESSLRIAADSSQTLEPCKHMHSYVDAQQIAPQQQHAVTSKQHYVVADTNTWLRAHEYKVSSCETSRGVDMRYAPSGSCKLLHSMLAAQVHCPTQLQHGNTSQ
eukprot:16058-Heterococcus_DN1.PRE.3